MQISGLAVSANVESTGVVVALLRRLIELEGAMAVKLIEGARVNSPAPNDPDPGPGPGIDVRI